MRAVALAVSSLRYSLSHTRPRPLAKFGDQVLTVDEARHVYDLNEGENDQRRRRHANDCHGDESAQTAKQGTKRYGAKEYRLRFKIGEDP
jgi:hypothetical protein